ncbi:MAG: winged helix-turn-helix domain-containing protein [Flavobacteriales bacterium]|jgi:DNA-binding winged helix-turn-helix (wHTH) protein|nr:winged helix-turn-helix domain-containing protein [Flavobacteriales bacterium]
MISKSPFVALLFFWLMMLFSFSGGAQSSINEQHRIVAFRSIGHEVLLSMGDSTSRVLPVFKIGNAYRVKFSSEFSFTPEELFLVVDSLVKRTSIAQEYILEVQECESQLVVQSWEVRVNKDSLLPCKSREQPQGCYELVFTIISAPPMSTEEQNTDFSTSSPWKILLYLGIPLVVVLAFFLKKSKPKVVNKENDFIALGEYRFDEKGMRLILGEEQIELTGKESDLLKVLHDSLNITIERDEILKLVWGDDGDYIGRTLDVFISKLRKKLEADPNVKILNVRGVGYKLILNEAN